MPKDTPGLGLGHRHEWESAVVWLDSFAIDANVLGVAVSQHGQYDTSTSPSLEEGVTPLVGYISVWPVNHQMIFTNEAGGFQPLVAWDSLTPKVRAALTNADFKDANMPLRDGDFERYLGRADIG